MCKSIIAVAALLATTFATAWWAYGEVGKTPGELMDYAERRLKGHNRLEWAALPIMAQMRIWLDQPSRAQLLRTPFVVPRPPPALQKAVTDVVTDAASPAPDSAQRILRVGPFESIRTIAQAARFAKDNDIVEIQAGEYHGDVALWNQKALTIRSRGGHARIFADGKSAEGKAIWVIRNGNFDIESIDFIGARVDDHNGAGIRFEGGNLRVKNCLFYGNDNGLLTGEGGGMLEIKDSEFAYNGFGDGFSHNLYVGKIHTFKISGSYFHHANVGHHIKSRAQHNQIYYNRITDESGGRASYEIDLPNGGIAFVVGNIIQQDVVPQNSTMIAFGVEGLAWPENRLYLASNTIVNDVVYGGTFLRTAPGTQRLVSINNLWVGRGKFHSGSVRAEIANDFRVNWELFEQASRHDYRLNAKGQMLPFERPAMTALMPISEYVHRLAPRALPALPTNPGAIQAR